MCIFCAWSVNGSLLAKLVDCHCGDFHFVHCVWPSWGFPLCALCLAIVGISTLCTVFGHCGDFHFVHCVWPLWGFPLCALCLAIMGISTLCIVFGHCGDFHFVHCLAIVGLSSQEACFLFLRSKWQLQSHCSEADNEFLTLVPWTENFCQGSTFSVFFYIVCFVIYLS